MEDDPARAPLAKRVQEATTSIEEALQVLFSDISYALLRAKLMAEMVIDVIAATELLKQAGVDASRIDLAHAFVRRRMLDVENKARRMLDVENKARRIQLNVEGRLDRDARLLEKVAPSS